MFNEKEMILWSEDGRRLKAVVGNGTAILTSCQVQDYKGCNLTASDLLVLAK